MGRVEKLRSKDNGARVWTPATRSALAMPGSPAAGRRRRNAAISWQGRGARLGGDSGIGRGEIHWTATPGGSPSTGLRTGRELSNALLRSCRLGQHPPTVAFRPTAPAARDYEARTAMLRCRQSWLRQGAASAGRPDRDTRCLPPLLQGASPAQRASVRTEIHDLPRSD